MVIPLRSLVIGGGGGYMSTRLDPAPCVVNFGNSPITLDLAVLYLKRASSLADPAISDLK